MNPIFYLLGATCRVVIYSCRCEMHKFAVKELANFFLTFSVIGNLNLCMMATEVVNFYCES